MKNPLRALLDLIHLPTKLRDEFKQKISEAHLKIRTGDCTPEQLDQATVHLREIQNKKVKLI